ncbi:MAG: ATP-binding protein [Phycisphaerales bacterium]
MSDAVPSPDPAQPAADRAARAARDRARKLAADSGADASGAPGHGRGPASGPGSGPASGPEASSAAQVLPTEPADIELEMWSQPRLLSAARAMITHLAQRLGFDEITAGQVSLAIDEALCNIINHGYKRRSDGRIWLHVWAIEAAPGTIVVSIEDRAEAVDPETIRGRDLDEIRPGGLGVYIMREVMDVVHYEQREGGGMRLVMRKRIDPDASPAGAEENNDG